jgi:ArsR family transcriptional regulator
MPIETREKALETLFKALADRTRLRILGLLAAGEVCVCHIHDSLGEPQPKISRHLAYLRRAGLVSGRKDGLWVHYRLAGIDDPLIRAALDAATHAVAHLKTNERDRQRLASRLPGTPAAEAALQGCCSTTCCAGVRRGSDRGHTGV